MKNKPVIIWEKWTNPLFNNNPSITEDEDEEPYLNFDDSDETIKSPMNIVITPLGIVPIEEMKDCDKVFNFWTGHTNFDISKTIAKLIEETDGVETLDIFTRYRFRVGFGKAFQDREVMGSINNTIYNAVQKYDNI